MNRTDAVFAAVTLAVAAFAVTYFLDPPAPRFYPAEGVWRMENRAGSPSMGWYGRSAWGLGIGCLVGVLTYRLVYRTPNPHGAVPPISGKSARLLSLLALAALILLAVYIVITEYDRLSSAASVGVAGVDRREPPARSIRGAPRDPDARCSTHAAREGPRFVPVVLGAVAARASAAAPVPARPVPDGVPASDWVPVAAPVPAAPAEARESECCSGKGTPRCHRVPGGNVPAWRSAKLSAASTVCLRAATSCSFSD